MFLFAHRNVKKSTSLQTCVGDNTRVMSSHGYVDTRLYTLFNGTHNQREIFI